MEFLCILWCYNAICFSNSCYYSIFMLNACFGFITHVWIVVLDVLRNMIEPRIEIEYILDGIEMFVNAWEWNGWILVLTNCKYTMLNSLHTNYLIKYQKEFLVLLLCTLMSNWVIKGRIVMCCTSPLGENDIYHLLRCDRCTFRWFCSQQVFGTVDFSWVRTGST